MRTDLPQCKLLQLKWLVFQREDQRNGIEIFVLILGQTMLLVHGKATGQYRRAFRAEPQAFVLVPFHICFYLKADEWRCEHGEILTIKKIHPAEERRWGVLKKLAPPFSKSHTSHKNSPCSDVWSAGSSLPGQLQHINHLPLISRCKGQLSWATSNVMALSP